MDAMKKEIGNKIKHLRNSKKITQQQLADLLGGDISRSTISNYEIGRRTPHLTELQRFAKVFGVGLDYFGVVVTDDIFDLLTRGKEVFESDVIPKEDKEKLYTEFMKFYLSIKEGE